MSDGSIKIDTKIDDSGIKKGLKNVESALGQVSKGFNISKVAAAGFAGVAAMGVGKVISIMNDCAATYRVQEKAEKALSAAAKNNPYLNDESVYNLKQFASELQKTSEVGDEVSIGLMAQLASAGRTQEEIQDIMRASADMAASGATTLDGAVKNLNKTYSGLSGELGEVIPELKGLTTEQMKNGAAVKLVSDKYKGIANETKQTSAQLGNAFGDLKETIGEGWDKSLEPARKLLLDIINKTNEVISKSREVQETFSKKIDDNNVTELDIRIKSNNDNIKIVEQQIAGQQALYKEYKVNESLVKANAAYYATLGIESTEALEVSLEKLKEEGRELENRKNKLQAQAKIESDAAAEAAAKTAETNAQNEKNKKAEGYLKAYEESLAKQIESIKLKAQLEGKSIESAAVQQEILNAQIGAYISLIENSEGLITGNTEREKERTNAIEQQAQAVTNLVASEEQRQKSLDDAIAANEAVRALLEQQPIDIEPEVKIQLDIDAVKEKAAKLRTEMRLMNDEELAALGMTNEQRLALIEDVNKKETELVEALEKQKEKSRQEGLQKEKDDLAAKITMLNDYMQQANQIAESIQQFATKQIETERDLRIAEIENSEMSEEEKEKAILDVKRDSAKEQYKIDMFAWSASLLAATANIAQGVSKAIAQGGVAGIITGALVAAAGAMQIASITASKPRPPAFASGGIVTGGIAGRDSVNARVMPGEMILNNRQQRALWETANGRRGGAGSNVVIHNSAANIVGAKPNITKDQIEIMIDARVKQSMGKGRYNDSFRQMQGGMNGTAYVT